MSYCAKKLPGLLLPRLFLVLLCVGFAGCAGTKRGVYHTVERGETLSGISAAYGVPVSHLQSWNDLEDPRSLRAGSQVFIPGARRVKYTQRVAAARSGRDDAPTASWTRKSQREEPRREASLRPVSPAPKPGFKLRWPVEGKVTSSYGFRNGLHHDGYDISAKEGDPIYAAADGRVLYSGDKLAGYGNLVIIRHAGSLSTVYAHNRENLVSEGDFVTAGQLIGKVGETGRASGPHVHFEVREGKKAVDPSRFLP